MMILDDLILELENLKSLYGGNLEVRVMNYDRGIVQVINEATYEKDVHIDYQTKINCIVID